MNRAVHFIRRRPLKSWTRIARWFPWRASTPQGGVVLTYVRILRLSARSLLHGQYMLLDSCDTWCFKGGMWGISRAVQRLASRPERRLCYHHLFRQAASCLGALVGFGCLWGSASGIEGGFEVEEGYCPTWVNQIRAFQAERVPEPLVVYVRPKLLVQEIQVLAMTVLPSDVRFVETLTAATSTLVAAALGYTRRHRGLFFIQQCLFKHIRRHLLILEADRIELRLLGVMPRFRACWRSLNRASNELFEHPIEGEVIGDVGLTRRQLQSTTTLGGCFRILRTVVAAVGIAPTEVEPSFLQLEEEIGVALKHARGRNQGWQRFLLRWAIVYMHDVRAHGLIKTRKARSIKKRRTKLLVRQTQYRFWPC